MIILVNCLCCSSLLYAILTNLFMNKYNLYINIYRIEECF